MSRSNDCTKTTKTTEPPDIPAFGNATYDDLELAILHVEALKKRFIEGDP